MADGGYDEGYRECPCFWGTSPAEMVLEATVLARKDGEQVRALDLGCGEGKNAAALEDAGFQVLAVDRSSIAISNAISAFSDRRVQWLVADLQAVRGPSDWFDVVVATGSLHCLTSEEEIATAVRTMQSMTRLGGLNVLYAFDDGAHDMSGHAPSFTPTLLPHSTYIGYYDRWEIVRASSAVQADKHPHNLVPHHHSITRLLARRVR